MYSTNYNPIWDSTGKLRSGCILKTALEWLTMTEARSTSANVSINDEICKISSVMRDNVLMEKEIKELVSTYYGMDGFIV